MTRKDKENTEAKSEKPLKDLLGMVEIIPEKNFHIVCNQWDIHITEGVSVPIPQRFLKNMVTEGVIKKIPKL